MTRTISVDHLARVEGHGGITVVLEGNEVKKVDYNIFEGIRLFEGLVRGRAVEDVTQICSRIAQSVLTLQHNLAAGSGECAGITVTPQTRKLRDLAYQVRISKPFVRLCLALPDLGGASAISLAAVA